MTSAQLKQSFLKAYERYGTVTAAAKAVELSRDTVYRWRREDSAFAEAFENAREAVADLLETECLRRAYAGSDLLLIFLLKGLKPEKFRERQETRINADNDAIRKFFDRAASEPLGPPALTQDISGLVVEAD